MRANYEPLINAFLESTNWNQGELTDRILAHGIDINPVLIKAIANGHIPPITRLLTLKIDQRIINQLHELTTKCCAKKHNLKNTIM